MIYFALYLLTILNSLSITFTFLFITGLLTGSFVYVVYFSEKASSYPNEKYISFVDSNHKKFLKWFSLVVAIAVLTPTKQSVLFVVGGGATYEVLTSEEAKETGGKVLEIVNKYLDEQVEEGDKR